MSSEQKKFWKIILTTAALVVAILAVAFLCNGCMSENTGSSTVVGEQMILPEITDSGDNIGVRIFEDIKGARVWTAKDSKVSIKYTNTWTNNYFGICDSKGNMGLVVDIEPLATDIAEEEETPEEPEKK